MSRAAAITRAHAYFDGGGFLADLTRRVAIPSSSQEPERAGVLRSYLDDEITPALKPLGFTCRVLDNPSGPPVLVAERIETRISSRCWSMATATQFVASTICGGPA